MRTGKKKRSCVNLTGKAGIRKVGFLASDKAYKALFWLGSVTLFGSSDFSEERILIFASAVFHSGVDWQADRHIGSGKPICALLHFQYVSVCSKLLWKRVPRQTLKTALNKTWKRKSKHDIHFELISAYCGWLARLLQLLCETLPGQGVPSLLLGIRKVLKNVCLQKWKQSDKQTKNVDLKNI